MVPYILAETQRQTAEWEGLMEHRKGRLWLCPKGALSTGMKQGILWDWLGIRIWLSLVGPKLEAGTKLGKLLIINQILAILD